MHVRQRGATFLGMVTIIAILGLGLYGVIRLTPIYFEYLAIVRAMNQTATENASNVASPQALRTSLDRRWAIEDIKTIKPTDIEIKKIANGYTMRAYYRGEAPFIGNVSLVMDSDKTVTVTQ